MNQLTKNADHPQGLQVIPTEKRVCGRDIMMLQNFGISFIGYFIALSFLIDWSKYVRH